VLHSSVFNFVFIAFPPWCLCCTNRHVGKDLKKAGILPWFYAAGCTDELQPVDDNVGATMKKLYTIEQETWLEDEENLELWEQESIPAWQRRVCVTNWLGLAKSKMAGGQVIRRAFERTGSAMDITGQNHELIEVDGLDEYKFSDYKFEGADDENVAGPAEGEEEKDPPEDEPEEDRARANPVIADDDADPDRDIAEQGDPDTDTEPDTLADAIPAGMVLQPVWEDADVTQLLGRHVMFNWKSLGWAPSIVTKILGQKRKDKRTLELSYPNEGMVKYDHIINVARYSTAADAPRGCWCLLQEAS
jgi:hypothetical protein